MTEIAIRQANSNDIQELCRLYYEFHEYHVRGIPDRLISLGPFEQFDPENLSRALQSIISGPDSALFVADQDGQCAGFAEVYLHQEKPDPFHVSRRYALLQSLFVAERSRRSGIGARLVSAAEIWARQQGAFEMRVDTWEFPGDPLDFYEAIGYCTLRRSLVRVLIDQTT